MLSQKLEHWTSHNLQHQVYMIHNIPKCQVRYASVRFLWLSMLPLSQHRKHHFTIFSIWGADPLLLPLQIPLLVIANELRWCAISREKRHQLPLKLKICCEDLSSLKNLPKKRILYNPLQFLIPTTFLNPLHRKKKGLEKSASSLPGFHLHRTLWFSGDRIALLSGAQDMLSDQSWEACHKITKISRTPTFLIFYTKYFHKVCLNFVETPQCRDILLPSRSRFLWRKEDGCTRFH